MRITVVRGDISAQEVDVVVNAADPSLLGGGGVDGAIQHRGGPAVRDACRELREVRYPDGLPVGQAVATTAGALPARWVVHTVGPRYDPDEDRSGLLASCYRESLRLADELGARAVAVPAVSTGAFGWPVGDAARVAVGAVHRARTQVAEVRFVMVDQGAVEVFDQERRRRGPTDEQIAADLRALPAERWRELFATADALTDADRAVRWGGGERLGPKTFHVSYPLYSDRVKLLFDALLPTVAFNWGEWTKGNPLYPNGDGLDHAPVADAARLATTYVRGERFSDGTTARALRDGGFDAVLRRLRRWYDAGMAD